MRKNVSGTKILLSFRPYFRPYERRIAAWFAVYAAYFVLGIFTPLAVKVYFDDVLPGGAHTSVFGFSLSGLLPPDPRARLWCFLGAYGLYAAGLQLFGLFGGQGTAVIIENVVADLRAMVYEKLHRLSIRYFDRNLSGEVVNKVTNDTRQLLNLVGQELVQVALNTGNGLLCLGLLMAWNWHLALVVLAFLPAYAWLFYHFLPLVRKAGRIWRRAEDRMWGNWGEKLQGMAVIQAFAREGREHVRQGKFSHGAARTWTRMALFGLRMRNLGGLSARASQHLAFCLGCVLLLGGDLKLGELFSLGGLITYILAPVESIFNVIETWQQSTVSAERIQKILEEVEEAVHGQGRRPVGRLRGEVSFDHVWFEYEKDMPVLQDVSFYANAGQSVALVGHTGCGKTTLMSLLQGFYPARQGTILVDGLPVGALLLKDLRANIGIVPQEVTLFQDTLRSNVAYGRPGAGDEELWRVLEAAQIADYVRSLPKGLDERVGEHGVTPSEGQAQRLSIARALLRDPRVIILDEATSSLDSREEAALQKAIGALLEKRTAFIIAHRLSTIRQCDLAVVMEKGRVLEKGNPRELAAREDSFFSKLARAHFSTGTLK